VQQKAADKDDSDSDRDPVRPEHERQASRRIDRLRAHHRQGQHQGDQPGHAGILAGVDERRAGRPPGRCGDRPIYRAGHGASARRHSADHGTCSYVPSFHA
jgi:hypothetical protein